MRGSIFDIPHQSFTNYRNLCPDKSVCEMLAVSKNYQSMLIHGVTLCFGTNQVVQIEHVDIGKSTRCLFKVTCNISYLRLAILG